MIQFTQEESQIILIYVSDNVGWIQDKFDSGVDVTIRKTFFFVKEDEYIESIPEDVADIQKDTVRKFVFAKLHGEYFKIDRRILATRHDIFIHKSMELKESHFIALWKVSIFKKISDLVKEDLYIGGENTNSMPISEYQQLVKEFPNQYEITKYVEARLGAVLGNYFDSAIPLEEKYKIYLNKKKSKNGANIFSSLRGSELLKYQIILKKLEEMLKDEKLYNEKQWQIEILQIILLLYPKYLYVFQEAPVYDGYNKKNREIDILLVDANGHADIIEIKKPEFGKIITNGTYRDNYIPKRELTGTVMQVEKYIFYLNKGGEKTENNLCEKYKDIIPKGFKIKIVNPCGIIIMGREDGLSQEQSEDFEVVKRKYKNIIDIITYDDLLKRLKFAVGRFQTGVGV